MQNLEWEVLERASGLAAFTCSHWSSSPRFTSPTFQTGKELPTGNILEHKKLEYISRVIEMFII